MLRSLTTGNLAGTALQLQEAKALVLELTHETWDVVERIPEVYKKAVVDSGARWAWAKVVIQGVDLRQRR